MRISMIDASCTRIAAALLFCAALASSAAAAMCGNGVVEPGEQCDVALTASGWDECDGCAADCTMTEECGVAACEDHLDNDGDGLFDADDSECAALAVLQPFAAVGSSARRSITFGRAATLATAAGYDSQAPHPFPYGEASGALCAGGSVALPPELEVGFDPSGCATALDALAQIEETLSELPRQHGGAIQVSSRQQAAIELPSGVTVLAYESLHIGNDATLTLKGPSDAVVVIEISGSVRLRARARLALAGGITANRVLWQVTGERPRSLNIGRGAVFAGTLFAPHRRVRTATEAELHGAIVADAIKVGIRSQLEHVPFTAALPADLTLASEAPPVVVAGVEALYRFEVSNRSQLAATAATLRIWWDGSMNVVGASSSQGTCVSQSGGTTTCYLGTVGPGEGAEIAITATTTAEAGTPLTLHAQVDAAPSDADATNNATINAIESTSGSSPP
ncbi:MAG TPA: ice-binding family protein [Terriglobales bacterium]|nr:ice-binding family protein [Terriglobales bacterium]